MVQKTNSIGINFFTIESQNFDILIYQKDSTDLNQKTPDYAVPVKRFSLPDSNHERADYFIALEPVDGFLQRHITPLDNVQLTTWYLFMLLEKKCKEINVKNHSPQNIKKYNFDYILHSSSLGEECICITPLYKKTLFGFLFNYHFKRNESSFDYIETQKLSLSLDKYGRENRNYYADKYLKIKKFIDSDFDKIFNSFDTNKKITVAKNMFIFPQEILNAKMYVFANKTTYPSQFQGIARNGPFLPIDDNPVLCFVYRCNEKSYSHKLYYALRGDTYPTFSGMKKMFNYIMTKENVIGVEISDYTESGVIKLIDEIKNKMPNKKIVPIVLVPWVKPTATEEQSKMYYFMKYQFLKNGMPSQFVGIDKVIDYESLKWSASGIGLQIFTKLGGSPWCLQPETKACLIIGIGQAHQRTKTGDISKYFSYSILSDASGLFKSIKILASNVNPDEYLDGLSKNLKSIIKTRINSYDNFVIHTSFRMRNIEMNTIKNIVSEMENETRKKFAVLRFDENHDYMGYDFSSNALTPHESVFVRLSSKEYLVWFEGLQYRTTSIKHRIGPPIKVNIDYPEKLDHQTIIQYLQDAINLSGANWRGFNAKTSPVSILYSHLISTFISAFDKYGFGKINIENITPWFL